MNQESSLTQKLTHAQYAHASAAPVLYRLYTKRFPNLGELAIRYFAEFTLIPTIGYRHGFVIEVIGSASDLQSVIHLAGDIRHTNAQSAVLVTWTPINSIMVEA